MISSKNFQGNHPAQHPAGPPPTQLPPNQVSQFQQIPVVNPRFFNPQNPPHMQPPPIQPFMVPPPPVLPPGYGQQHIAVPGGQQASTTQAGGGPPPMIRHMMYTHQIQPQQPQFVNAQIPLHPQQMIPPPVLAARPGMVGFDEHKYFTMVFWQKLAKKNSKFQKLVTPVDSAQRDE